MATDKLFKVFGVSKLNGEYKVRFANDIMRIKVLAKHDHEDIRLVELDTAVTKYEGIKQIATHAEFADAAAQAAIAEYLDEKAPKAKATKTSPAVKATKATKPVKNTKKSREAQALAEAAAVAKADKMADLEDAPF